MKKILIVNDSFGLGGIQRVASTIGNELSKKHDVHYYSLNDENFYGIKKNKLIISKSASPNKAYKFIVRVFRFGKRKIFKSYNHTNVMKKVISELINVITTQKFNVVIMNSGFFSTLIPSIKNSVDKDVKFIAWMHNSYDIYLNKYFYHFKAEYIKSLEFADCLVCLTEIDRDKFLNHNQNAIVIHNPIDLKSYKGNKSDLTKKEIAFASRLVYEQKGIDLLKQIVQKTPENWTVKIAGGGSKKQVKYFLNDFNDLIKCKKVIFYGQLTSEELITFYKDSSLFISTSRWEGFGLVIIEAMACGLPVIAFNNQGPAEILDNNWCLVDKFDLKQFEEKINTVIDNYDLRNMLAQENLLRVNCFSVSSIIKKWNDILDNCI